jgi:hypothetical protein
MPEIDDIVVPVRLPGQNPQTAIAGEVFAVPEKVLAFMLVGDQSGVEGLAGDEDVEGAVGAFEGAEGVPIFGQVGDDHSVELIGEGGERHV